EQALNAALDIKDERSRADALIELASDLPEDPKAQVVQEALALTRKLPEWDFFESPRAAIIARLAPHLTEPLKMEALETARAIGNREAQARALAGLVPYLPAELKAKVVQEALDAVQAIPAKAQVRTLTDLAPYLPEALNLRVA